MLKKLVATDVRTVSTAGCQKNKKKTGTNLVVIHFDVFIFAYAGLASQDGLEGNKPSSHPPGFGRGNP